MNKKYSELSQDHSLHYLEMAFRTDKCARLESPDGYGKHKGACGDTVEMFILVRNERIQSAAFISNGCLNTHVCANTVALLAEGKSINDAWSITPEQVKNYLETLLWSTIGNTKIFHGKNYTRGDKRLLQMKLDF